MADVIIENGFKDIDEIWAMEQSLYFPGLYSGTTDLVCVYKGNPCRVDYKQTNRPKKEEWVEDYKIQLVAYLLAHNEVYGTNMREGHIFMVSRGDNNVDVGGEVYQQFDLSPNDFNKYQDLWLDKIDEYYQKM
jgi:genome maintenance exonuclease 1